VRRGPARGCAALGCGAPSHRQRQVARLQCAGNTVRRKGYRDGRLAARTTGAPGLLRPAARPGPGVGGGTGRRPQQPRPGGRAGARPARAGGHRHRAVRARTRARAGHRAAGRSAAAAQAGGAGAGAGRHGLSQPTGQPGRPSQAGLRAGGPPGLRRPVRGGPLVPGGVQAGIRRGARTGRARRLTRLRRGAAPAQPLPGPGHLRGKGRRALLRPRAAPDRRTAARVPRPVRRPRPAARTHRPLRLRQVIARPRRAAAAHQVAPALPAAHAHPHPRPRWTPWPTRSPATPCRRTRPRPARPRNSAPCSPPTPWA